ncbi:MAG: hypothetical protein U9R34_04145 [Nanoarchaeota archaeon]|nr:hypothetical protein [Nanoarchaeota archaeon]
MISQIPKVFLENFRESDESFLIHQGMIYTLHCPTSQNSLNKLFYANRDFNLFQSEDIDTLQEEYLNHSRDSIENLVSDYIQHNYIEKLERLKINIDSQKNLFQETQNNSIEKLIVLDIFDKFCNLCNVSNSNGNKNNKSKTVASNLKLSAINKTMGLSSSLDYAAFGKTPFARYLNSISMMVLGQRAYSLRKENSITNNYVQIKNHKYKICESQTFDRFILDYKKIISKSITSVIQKESSNYINQLSEFKKAKTELDILINQENQFNELKERERRAEMFNCTIGFKARGKNNSQDIYDIYIKLDPYIMKKDDNYYQFDTVKIGTSLAVSRNQIKITNKPEVLTKEYHHPFVWDWLKICDKGYKKDRYEREGVNFENFNVDYLDGFARNVAVALNVAKKIIEYGYNGSRVSPVKKLSPSKFPEEYIRGGKSAALSTGIRIVDNDLWKENINPKKSNIRSITRINTDNLESYMVNYLQNNQNNLIYSEGM